MTRNLTDIATVLTTLVLAGPVLAQGAPPAGPPAPPPADAPPAPPPADAPPTGAPPADAPPTGAAPADAPPADLAPTSDQPVGEAPPGEAAPGAAGTEVTADMAAGDSATELPGQAYRFIGLRYRAIIVPKFMMNLFGSGGRTVVVHAGGPEFAIRKDGFEVNFAAWFANYAMKETPFKAKDDGENAWEVVSSEVKAIYLTSDFLWSHDFSPEFALNYGGSAGFGIIFGDLFRTQSRPPGVSASPTPGDPETYVKCPGGKAVDQARADASGNYCGTDNDHYDGYTEPSWADGGSKPIIFPWLALQTGLRIKPAKEFVARIDLGFGTSGFFAGLGLDYGL